MPASRFVALGCALALAGCQTAENNQNTIIGAVAGAAVGAAAGTLVGGDDRRNALVGAGIGLLAGSAVGYYLDEQERQLREDLAGTGAQVERQGDSLLVNFPGNVTFATDSAAIQPQFYSTLDSVSSTLNQYPESYLDVVGHTDSTGSETYNLGLSERRAGSVANYLRSRGVLPARVATYGQGELAPIATNETPEGRQQNRRVELKITPATQG
ncbi:MAG: OmpA family protein [Pseudomonadota bacterium]